jgi:hypothetical protein
MESIESRRGGEIPTVDKEAEVQFDKADFVYVEVLHVSSTELSIYEIPNAAELEEQVASHIVGRSFRIPSLGYDYPDIQDITVSSKRVRTEELEGFGAKNFDPKYPGHAYVFRVAYRRAEWEKRAAERKLNPEDAPTETGLKRFFCAVSNSAVNLLIILLNISAPGFCYSEHCIVRFGEFEEQGEPVWGCVREVYFDKLISGGGIGFFSPSKVLEWSHCLNGFWSGVPDTNVERSLSYYSYLFSRDAYVETVEMAVWAYGALDAFYGDTGVGIIEKLRKRTSLVLTKAGVEFSPKSINQIYNDRSRVLHGQAKFSANFCDPYERSGKNRYSAGVYETAPSALYLVIESLRFAAVSNARSIMFEEVVTT